MKLFIDSGAFSAMSQKTEIDISDYIKFIKDNEDCIDYYANLDVIGSAKLTLKNQRIMEREGLRPLPVFHVGEDFEFLEYYIERYPYICLGGIVGANKNKAVEFLDRCFSMICDSKGNPKNKIHGFGVTYFELLFKYPWNSVDSTSWLKHGVYGRIWVPQYRNGNFDYFRQPHLIEVSAKQQSRTEIGSQHIDTFPVKIRQVIIDYIESKGYVLGNDKTKGLSNDGELRNEINLIYLNDLSKALTDSRPSFIPKKAKGFSL